ncbi:MAG: FeS assembly SUF system protein [Flavobacteriales bacterium BRH_c54]|jgi:FeS assembly SUF system protein|nr:MAG: FeS assembly SUF system protein [Flavobacteriales bacterium BRH_c54]
MEENKEHTNQLSKQDVELQIIEVLKSVYDPEIPVDIYELGLIYEIKLDEEFNAEILMTLTSPSCPVAESLPEEVRQKIEALWSVKSCIVTMVWEPSWNKDMMSEEAKFELGFM